MSHRVDNEFDMDRLIILKTRNNIGNALTLEFE